MDEQPKVLLIGEGNIAKTTRIKEIFKLIQEGKIIVISNAVEFEEEISSFETARGVGKTMASFSASIESMGEALKELVETMKISEFKVFDYYPFEPIQHNYRQPKLNYNFMRDKRKYRAPINRR